MVPTTITSEQRIAELGIELSPAPQPLGAYTETVQSRHLLFVSGTIPTLGGIPQYTGTLGKDLDLEDGRKAAHLAALNALAAARQHLGSLERIKQVLKTEIYMVSTPEFVVLQPKTADGASELLLAVFGEQGRSVRKILGVSSIPLHVPLVVELLLEVEN